MLSTRSALELCCTAVWSVFALLLAWTDNGGKIFSTHWSSRYEAETWCLQQGPSCSAGSSMLRYSDSNVGIEEQADRQEEKMTLEVFDRGAKRTKSQNGTQLGRATNGSLCARHQPPALSS